MNEKEREKINELLFTQLVMSLNEAAMMQIGKIINPATGKIEKNLAQAKGTIDLLQMFKDKTAGNLNKLEEAKPQKISYDEANIRYWKPYKIIRKDLVGDSPDLKFYMRDLEAENKYHNVMAGLLSFTLYMLPFGESAEHLYTGIQKSEQGETEPWTFAKAGYTAARDVIFWGTGLPGNTYSKPVTITQNLLQLAYASRSVR